MPPSLCFFTWPVITITPSPERLLDLPEYFESVHAGYLQVGEYDAWVMFPNQPKAGFAVFSGQHRITVGIQKQTEHGQGGGFIVDDQDRFRGIHRNGHSLRGRLDKKGVLFLLDGTMIPETGTFATISLRRERPPIEEIVESSLDYPAGSRHLHRDCHLLYMRVVNRNSEGIPRGLRWGGFTVLRIP